MTDHRPAANHSSRHPTRRMDVANEFAHVTLEIVETGNGARLRVRDNGAGRAIDLDAFVLAALVWLNESDLDRIVDPQFMIESGVRGRQIRP